MTKTVVVAHALQLAQQRLGGVDAPSDAGPEDDMDDGAEDGRRHGRRRRGWRDKVQHEKAEVVSRAAATMYPCRMRRMSARPVGGRVGCRRMVEHAGKPSRSR